MNTKQLKNKILDLAIRGQLVEQDPNDEPAQVLLERIINEKSSMVTDKKKKKTTHKNPYQNEEEFPFEIPQNWAWCRLGEIINLLSGQDLKPNEYNDVENGIPYITGASNFSKGKLNINRWTEFGKNIAQKGNLLITCKGTVGDMAILEIDKVHIARQIMSIFPIECETKYILYFLSFKIDEIKQIANGLIPGISRDDILHQIFPLPPLSEQRRIVSKIEEIFALIDELEINKTDLQTLIKQTKTKVLDLAIRGKLLNEENALSFEEATSDNGHYNDFPFPIPKHWQWKKLSEVSNIARGGSPRPIKDFLTDEDNGINWIKIGDTEQGGKYIYSTNEKIKPEGIKYSRFVEEDNFLLTNSMSFGRPYILKTNGCIHDGWLVIKLNKEILSVDFTYYLLSSKFMFDQFSNLAVGSTVKNLKSESVQNSIIPLPPLSEQEKIVQKIEKIFSELEKIEAMING